MTQSSELIVGASVGNAALADPAAKLISPATAAALALNEGGLDALVGERLTMEAFFQLAGSMGGYSFVKVVVDRKGRGDGADSGGEIHFINHARYQFHAHYVGDHVLKIGKDAISRDIDAFNQSVYFSSAEDRRFYFGILAFHKRGERRFFALETVEVDTMDAGMVRFFHGFVKRYLDPSVPLLFKPGNHFQERIAAEVDPAELPRVLSHELFSTAQFIALNPGVAKGRLRAFRNEAEYRRALPTIEWFDIIVMHRVPDDIPRVAGIINAEHTTPLSHTNVLASGWQIPNSIQLGIFESIDAMELDGQWVSYAVSMADSQIQVARIEKPEEVTQRPGWSIEKIKLEEPETVNTPILELDRLRMSDRYRYGTKAANLGELRHVLDHGSDRLLGFYKVRRPPRANLLPYLARFLGANGFPAAVTSAEQPAVLNRMGWEFLRATIRIPRGIAIPFSVQQDFLESSPRIQQAIGKLKMALELKAREIDPLCVNLQRMIRQARMPEKVRNYIDGEIANALSGVSSFVVRSSSNAEDLEKFSAAGIYESINHVTTAENIFQSIKEVWASLLSPRSVRLRHDVGISLDDCYMGVIVQEEVSSKMGGVLVTTNPMNRAGDFRSVYINVSGKSVENVVDGSELPYQYLFNTVEGGGRTVSLGSARTDLPEERKQVLQRLAVVGRLLQSHFSPDYTFSAPVDIEWLANEEGLFVLQLRPYAK